MDRELNKIIKQHNINCYLPLMFCINEIKNSLKYKKINKKLINNIKKKNNLIICACCKKTESKQISFINQIIFDCYVEFYHCAPSFSEYKKMLKIYNCTQYENLNAYDIYSYYLLKYIKKSEKYRNFSHFLANFIKISKSNKNLTPIKNNIKSAQLGAIFNKSCFAFFCENGTNYLAFNKQYITDFSYNLVKQNNIEILINNINILENGSYSFYENKIIVSKNNNFIVVKLNENKLKFNVYAKENSKIKILIDKNCEIMKTANSFKLKSDNIECKVRISTNQTMLINNETSFGFELLNNVKSTSVELIYNCFNCEYISKKQRKIINQQINEYYKFSNYIFDEKEIANLQSFNINYPIKNLPYLSEFGFKQCNFNSFVVDNLNFNSKCIIPNKNIYHLKNDGKIFNINNVIENQSVILLNKVNEVYIDICTINFSFKLTSKHIKIINPVLKECYFINCVEKIINAIKIFNFLKISFKNIKNNIILIANKKKKIEINNYYKFAMRFNSDSLKLLNFDFNLPNMNAFLFQQKINKINYFSEEFAILHQKINKKCDFLPIFSNFNNKTEVVNLFLNYSDWINKHNDLMLDYLYGLSSYSLALIVKDNLKRINFHCKNIELKNAIADQIGQIYPTIIDEFCNGNFALEKDISFFYYCYAYILLIENLQTKNLSAFKMLKRINLLNSDKKLILNNSHSVELNNVNYVGFSKIENQSGDIFLNF